MKTARLIIVLCLMTLGAYLLIAGVVSWVRIQGQAELSADARSAAITRYAIVYVMGASVAFFSASFVGRFDLAAFSALRGGQHVQPPNDITKPPAPPAPPNGDRHASEIETLRKIEAQWRELQDAQGDAAAATVITLREPNIDLSITLTGDAASDAVGRKKIGAVMEHYGSGAVGLDAPTLDPKPGPSIPAKVTSSIVAPVFQVEAEGGAA